MITKAYGENVLIEQESADASKSGLVIPDEAKDDLKVAKGIVHSVGTHADSNLVGRTVYFNKFSGDRIINNEGKERLILKEKDVLAVDYSE